MQQLSLCEIDMVSGGELLAEMSPGIGAGGRWGAWISAAEAAMEFYHGVVKGWNSFKK